MDGWMDGWKGGWLDGRPDGFKYFFLLFQNMSTFSSASANRLHVIIYRLRGKLQSVLWNGQLAEI